MSAITHTKISYITFNDCKIPIAKDDKTYEKLVNVMKELGTLWCRDLHDPELKEETLSKYLNRGGSKKVYEISRGRAMILPNLDHDNLGASGIWTRMAVEESKMAIILELNGLLSLRYRLSFVTLENSKEGPFMCALVCDTFEQLATKGCYIIDKKNSEASTWKSFLFKTDEERLDEKNWKPVLDRLYTDIARLSFNQMEAYDDSLNVAVVKRSEPLEGSVSDYEVRFFGFDFSRKSYPRAIPSLKPERFETSCYKEIIEYYVKEILQILIFSEFPKSTYSVYGELWENLKKSSCSEVMNRMDELFPNVTSK